MSPSLKCRRIMEADDPSYRRGLELLWQDGRIEPNFIDTPEDFCWWMKGWEVNRSESGDADYIFVVEDSTLAVLGFAYSEYYAPEGWLFVGYLVAKPLPGVWTSSEVSSLLFSSLAHVVSSRADSKGILYEMGFGGIDRARDRVFRLQIAQRGLKLRKTLFLQPALSVADGSYSAEEECLCVATPYHVNVDVKTVVDFMYQRIYNVQDQGSAAYLAHRLSVEQQMMQLLAVRDGTWSEMWNPKIEDGTLPFLGMSAASTSSPGSAGRGALTSQTAAFLERLRDGCFEPARAQSEAQIEEVRHQARKMDVIVDEVRDELFIRGRCRPLSSIGRPERALLWLILTHLNRRVSYANLRELLDVQFGPATIQSYRSRLTHVLGKHLGRRILRAVRGEEAWVVSKAAWSFAWLRSHSNHAHSALIHGLPYWRRANQ